jgi:hypothetical protein
VRIKTALPLAGSTMSHQHGGCKDECRAMLHAMKHPALFPDQIALHRYAEDHGGLVPAFEGTSPWRKWTAQLAPGEIKAACVMVCTPQGMTRVLLVSKAMVKASVKAVTAASIERAERRASRS